MTITMKPLRLVAAAFALAVPLASPAGDGLEVKFRSRALLDAVPRLARPTAKESAP